MDTGNSGWHRSVLLMALFGAWAAPSAVSQIVVGPNVHVSQDRPKLQHGEDLAAADPANASNIIACSMAFFPEKNVVGVTVYVSSDGGKTWRHSQDFDSGDYSGDPDCGYLPNGNPYLVIDHEPGDTAFLAFYRSPDGGKSWLPPTILRYPRIDREFVSIDRTNGKYNARVYITAQMRVPQLGTGPRNYAMGLWRSLDGGATFEKPICCLPSTTPGGYFHPGNSAVLSDGTVVSSFTEFLSSDPSHFELLPFSTERPNTKLWVATSEDGGETFRNTSLVTQAYSARGWRQTANGIMVLSLSADHSTSAFRDRLYLVWQDSRSGRTQILFSHSGDKGKTWSKPKRVDDGPEVTTAQRGPDSYLPVVAVNRDGVVGVAWFDRRDNPDDLGSWLRFSTSLDGGETFLPSVRVSKAPSGSSNHDQWSIQTRSSDRIRESKSEADGVHRFSLTRGWFEYYAVGHTNGLAVDASGVFHPVWIDNRTGVNQLWTAPVIVKGVAVRNGSESLSRLDDISQLVALELSNPRYDRGSDTASVDIRLKNVSTNILRGEFKIRILGLESELGIPSILAAGSRSAGSGAVLDFGVGSGNGTLAPGQTSSPITLNIRFTAVQAVKLEQDGKVRSTLLKIDAKVLGETEQPKRPSAAAPQR